ncbi:hypothetical protein DEU56DRAFT_924469 [Suillus clintonianus]|uniref:uncharacterized protein n=1 Tax=Suillus clintonianus TaxID=1904413 RepID=UPI001B87E241|nr:uncharacterized protein DEU56DRAFT_924469 [Suillus clintonianus]KAG2149151.1 hypothetical protein DEU56DRAFT_924469 [Suillus clintonianus]
MLQQSSFPPTPALTRSPSLSGSPSPSSSGSPKRAALSLSISTMNCDIHLSLSSSQRKKLSKVDLDYPSKSGGTLFGLGEATELSLFLDKKSFRYRLKVYRGLRMISIRQLKAGGALLLHALSTFTTTGAGITAGSTSALSIASSRQDSSTAWSKEETGHFSGVSAAARVRLESMGGRSSSADLPSTMGPLAIRRPGINPDHPFKTSTLSSGSPSLHSPSPFLRQPSPLATGHPSLPSRPVPTSPNSSRVPHSSIGFGRQSPSSIGGRSDGENTSLKIPTRKHYSSSFGHRYAAAGGVGSVGSAGSGERAETERSADNVPVQSTSFLGVPTDDDDEISIFVKDIDARKPLNAQCQPLLTSSQGPPTMPSHTQSDSTGSAGPMLTQQSEVDECLSHMNEMFLASLEGLGGNGGRRRGLYGWRFSGR